MSGRLTKCHRLPRIGNGGRLLLERRERGPLLADQGTQMYPAQKMRVRVGATLS